MYRFYSAAMSTGCSVVWLREQWDTVGTGLVVFVVKSCKLGSWSFIEENSMDLGLNKANYFTTCA